MSTPQGPYPPQQPWGGGPQQPGQFPQQGPQQGPPQGPPPGFGPGGPGGPRPQGPPSGPFQQPPGPGQQQRPGGWGPPGQQQPGAGDPFKEKKSKKGLFIGIGVVVLLGAVAAVLFFLGVFTTTVFDKAALENGVKGVLTEKFGVAKLTAIDCGKDNKIAAGTQFQCTVTINGQPKKVLIKVENDNGLYTVFQPK